MRVGGGAAGKNLLILWRHMISHMMNAMEEQNSPLPQAINIFPQDLDAKNRAMVSLQEILSGFKHNWVKGKYLAIW